MAASPNWVPEAAVRAIHAALIAEHGGLAGPANEPALSSTLARPRQHLTCADRRPSLATLAASYGSGLARNHCFPDGNERVALAVMDVFLQLNGHELTAPEPESVAIIVSLASGRMPEDELAAWIKANIKSQ